jgi:phage terminase small subunit
MNKGNKLNAKQDRFCREYIIDLNATQAAIRAGYSKKTARATGCENLTKQNIATRIKELQSTANKKSEITAEYVLQGIRAIAEGPEDTVRNGDRLKAFELLGKHLVLFSDRQQVEHSGSVEFKMVYQPPKKEKQC